MSRGNEPSAKSLRTLMENIQFEIPHDSIILLLAKQLSVPAEQISIGPLTAEETSAVRAVVRVDLATANMIDRKIRRLESKPAGKAAEE
jgi:hypothetical protein